MSFQDSSFKGIVRDFISLLFLNIECPTLHYVVVNSVPESLCRGKMLC